MWASGANAVVIMQATFFNLFWPNIITRSQLHIFVYIYAISSSESNNLRRRQEGWGGERIYMLYM